MKVTSRGATWQPSTPVGVIRFIVSEFVWPVAHLFLCLAGYFQQSACFKQASQGPQALPALRVRAGRLWLAGLLAVWLGLPTAHAEVVITSEQHWPLLLRDEAGVLLDTSGHLDLSEVRQLSNEQDGFKSWFAYPQPLSLSGNTWWLHWDFVNEARAAETYRLLLGSPLLQHIDFYVVQEGEMRHSRAGSAVPVSQRFFPSREPTVQFHLEPGAQASVYVRLQTAKQNLLAPRLYTEEAYGKRELRAASWDAALWGGLLALGWVGLMLGLFSRTWLFALMGAMCVSIVLFEASYRGYAQLYLWPEAVEWGYRSASVFGAASIALLPLFVLGVARYEKITLPWSLALVGLSVLQILSTLLAIFGPYDTVGRIVEVGNNLFMVAALAIAVRLLLGALMSARLMLMVMAFAVFNSALRMAESYGVAPDFVMRWGFDLHPNPVVALIGFGLNLVVLAGWISYIAEQRLKARDALIDWQIREKERLEAEVQRQTQALRAALADAEEKTRQKAQVLGYVSHDLRAPLAAIAGYSEVLSEVPPAEQTRHLKAIDRAVHYQLQLIDELLEFSQEELQPLHIRPEQTDLLALLQGVGDHAAGLARRQNNHFAVEALSEFPRWVEVDPRRLQQVLLNLLANAAKFTRQGEIRLQVKGQATADAWKLCFTVSDSGIGIEAAQQKNVFQAFQQLKQAHGSVGLGLFIAQRIVDGMGGELSLDSQLGEGSVFYVELQLRSLADEKVAAGVLQDDLWEAPEQSISGPLPPVSLRAELVLLARSGRLSDIEDWIAEQRKMQQPWTAFLDEVQDAWLELDFEAVERVANLEGEA